MQIVAAPQKMENENKRYLQDQKNNNNNRTGQEGGQDPLTMVLPGGVGGVTALLVCVIIRLLVSKSMTPRPSLYIQSPIESMAAANVFDIASFENSLSKYV